MRNATAEFLLAVLVVYPPISSLADELAAPPAIETLHYREVYHFRIDGRLRTTETIYDADLYRERAERRISDEGITDTATTRISIEVFDPDKGITTTYELDPVRRVGMRGASAGRWPMRGLAMSRIDRFTTQWYPQGEHVTRLPDESVDGVPAHVYQWLEPGMDGAKWYLTHQHGNWIPLQRTIISDEQVEPERVFDVRINEPLAGSLFIPPQDYAIEDQPLDSIGPPGNPIEDQR